MPFTQKNRSLFPQFYLLFSSRKPHSKAEIVKQTILVCCIGSWTNERSSFAYIWTNWQKVALIVDCYTLKLFGSYKTSEDANLKILVINKCKSRLEINEGSSDNSLLQPEINITPVSFHNYFVNFFKSQSALYKLHQINAIPMELL